MMKEKDNKKGRSDRRKRPEKVKDEFDQKLIDIARVTRVMAGGKRMSFRACIVIGDRKGKVGMGLRKGTDVSVAINKAVRAAKKQMIDVNIINDTIPRKVVIKHGASRILLKPAPSGTGVIAGGAIRSVLELAGIKNIVSKIMGTKNKVNNVKATIEGLKGLHDIKQLKEIRK